MKSKTMILMVVAVVCGLVASYLTSTLIAQKNKKVQLVVAKKAITSWTPIKNPEEMFELREWAEADAPTDAVTDLKALQDRVVLKDIEAEKPVALNMLLDKSKVGLEGMLEKGTRAIAIVVNAASTAGGFVAPGSKVDIIHASRTPGAEPRMVLENVLVRAVDLLPVRPEDRAGMVPQTVTFQLSPEQCLKLSSYVGTGTLTLALRPYGDVSTMNPEKGGPGIVVPKPGNDPVPARKRDRGFHQTIVSGGNVVKDTPFIKVDKEWKTDTNRNPDYQSPNGDSEGK